MWPCAAQPNSLLLVAVLLGECELKQQVATREALAVKDKNGVAHCFLVRRRGGD